MSGDLGFPLEAFLVGPRSFFDWLRCRVQIYHLFPVVSLAVGWSSILEWKLFDINIIHGLFSVIQIHFRFGFMMLDFNGFSIQK